MSADDSGETIRRAILSEAPRSSGPVARGIPLLRCPYPEVATSPRRRAEGAPIPDHRPREPSYPQSPRRAPHRLRERHRTTPGRPAISDEMMTTEHSSFDLTVMRVRMCAEPSKVVAVFGGLRYEWQNQSARAPSNQSVRSAMPLAASMKRHQGGGRGRAGRDGTHCVRRRAARADASGAGTRLAFCPPDPKPRQGLSHDGRGQAICLRRKASKNSRPRFMRTIEWTGQFKQDYRREARGRHRTILDGALFPVVDSPANDLPLQPTAVRFTTSMSSGSI